MNAMIKKCFKCEESKPIDEFYKHKAMADGHLNKCKSCTKSDVFNRRHGDGREKVLAYDRKRATNPIRIKAAKKVRADWIKKHPERRSAQNAVTNAVRKGLLTPLPCFECGEKAEAHHPDYSKPLDVVWLCPSHHKQTHAMQFAA